MRTRPFLTAGALSLTLLSAAPAVADEAPVVVADCAAIVTGTPGGRVALAPASVTEPVVSALVPLDPLGLLTGVFRSVWATTAPIPVGTVPTGEAEIPGDRIADAVLARLGELPVLAPVLTPLLSTVDTVLTPLCRILVRGGVPGAPPESAPAPPPPSAGGTVPPGGDGAVPPGGGDPPTAGRQWVVAAVPGATSSGGTVFGTPIPGRLPGFDLPVGAGVPQAGGVPVAVDARPPAGSAEPRADVVPVVADARRAVGRVEGLPTRLPDELSLPVLAAILLLAAVSARLVRRWGLRSPR
ncbi:hypothetical protein [Actinokineospora spheciospongiae]|uniref:hypothetical protein n=1 Tax=Actinokineospora spheciospongiae TaxID=909613 RepID=UPI000D716D7F|nr:hypothetical protein [Actinokineospora spheciospongiae]PWW53706.1 hypothetical protein DFQ13_11590 [Actinokineospora spheciospongiae]